MKIPHCPSLFPGPCAFIVTEELAVIDWSSVAGSNGYVCFSREHRGRGTFEIWSSWRVIRSHDHWRSSVGKTGVGNEVKKSGNHARYVVTVRTDKRPPRGKVASRWKLSPSRVQSFFFSRAVDIVGPAGAMRRATGLFGSYSNRLMRRRRRNFPFCESRSSTLFPEHSSVGLFHLSDSNKVNRFLINYTHVLKQTVTDDIDDGTASSINKVFVEEVSGLFGS